VYLVFLEPQLLSHIGHLGHKCGVRVEDIATAVGAAVPQRLFAERQSGYGDQPIAAVVDEAARRRSGYFSCEPVRQQVSCDM